MRTFPASDLQRSAAEVQKAAALAPIVLTHHDKPRFVMMSLEDYARLSGAKLKASPENLPDSVVARLQGSADACVDDELGLVGDLEGYLNA